MSVCNTGPDFSSGFPAFVSAGDILTDLVRSMSAPGHGARIFVKDEAANMAGSFKDRRASVSIHVAAEKGYPGVIAATSGNRRLNEADRVISFHPAVDLAIRSA